MTAFTLICHSGAPPLARLRASLTRYGGEPGIRNPGAAEYGFRLSLTSFARPE
jgi:hypothetical protein